MNGRPLWNISTPAYYMFATSGPTLQFDPEALASSSGALNTIQSSRKQCKPFRGKIFHQCSQTYFNALPKKMKRELVLPMNGLKMRNSLSILICGK